MGTDGIKLILATNKIIGNPIKLHVKVVKFRYVKG